MFQSEPKRLARKLLYLVVKRPTQHQMGWNGTQREPIPQGWFSQFIDVSEGDGRMSDRAPDIVQFHRELERLSRLQRLVWVWHLARAGVHPYPDSQTPDSGAALPSRALVSRGL